MSLRHSYAIHQLQAGASVREVQENLGHRSVETTLVYLACLPIEVESPLDALPERQIPVLPVVDSVPPFPVEDPPGFFRAWLRTLFRRRRPPGSVRA